jgi:glycosyltransferase involved in cell wall biosynthesis/SAM-dependent methyltransferase
MTARVSVVINTYNRAASLRRTLESLAQLEYPAFEVIVVNGPSTDDTEGLLKAYADRIKVGQCENRNLSESRNIGIRLAAGEFVAFIDDDAYPDPAWLDRLVEGFDEDEVAAVGGPVYDHTGATLQARYSLATRLGDARVSSAPNPTEYLNVPLTHEFVYTIGTNAAFRYDRLVSIGGFDEEFEYYMDETDVCCRLIDQGLVVRALDDGFVYHKFLESDVRTPNRAIRSRFSVLKNKCYFALKHGLRTHSFYEVCQNLVEGVDRNRADFRWNVEHGLLTEDDLAQFERDAHHAFNVALGAFQSGHDRTRPPEWFDRATPSFAPFPTRRPLDRKLHLCFFSQEYPPGQINGIARVIHTLATGLAAEGHLVRVLTKGQGHDRVDLEDGVWVHRVVVQDHPLPGELDVPPHIWNYSASLLEELRRIHSHRAVDVVEAPNWDSEIVAVLLDGDFVSVVGLYTPLSVVRTIDPDLVGANPHIDAMLQTDRFCYEHATALRAAGSSVVEKIEEAYGLRLPRNRIGFIAHGMVDDTVGVEPRRHGDGLNVLYVGRLERRKGIDTLLEAIPALLEEFPDSVFTIVGDDSLVGDEGRPYRVAFEEKHGSDLPAGSVAFTGIVDDAERQRLYAGCDIFVAPSRFESFGLILVEAMMFGKPVVGGDNGGMRQIIEHDGNGFLVPPGDSGALRSALIALMGSAERRGAFGRRSREIFEEQFSVTRMVKDCNEFYDGLVERTTTTRQVRPPLPIEPRVSEVAALAPEDTYIPESPTLLVERMRCPTCHSPVVAVAETMCDNGRIKGGQIWCETCRCSAAEVENFKFDFHSREKVRRSPERVRVVPELGERRVAADAAELEMSAGWVRHDGLCFSQGAIGDCLQLRAKFTDAVVRLVRNPWSGVVDLFLDDILVRSFDLFMPEGSQVVGLVVAADVLLGDHKVSVRPRGTADPSAQGKQVILEGFAIYGPRSEGFPEPTPINLGNPYSEVIEKFLAEVPEDDLVLECGGGDRRRCQRNHVNFEYLPFELADLYGDIHEIPFRDDTFGLVFSQAVFEHVRQPFEAAQELIRVTRPGGLIITEVAFLQPLHAVPYHFFNMTTWGVEELFKSCTILESDWFGDLSVTVDWLLRSVNLPGKVPDDRLRGIVEEFRELDKFVTHGELKAVASGVYIVARKDPQP